MTACSEDTTNSSDDSFAKRQTNELKNRHKKQGRFPSVLPAFLHFHACVCGTCVKLEANKHRTEDFSEWTRTNLTNPARAMVKGLRSGREWSSCYYLMNDDDVAVNYSAVHNTRDGTQHKPCIECHCCIFQYDSFSVSTVTEVQGLSICCAYDMWVTKLLSMEISEGRGREERQERE